VISRRHVWSTFLGRSTNAATFSDEAIDKLSELQLNGRQIKNVLKTAHLLAAEQETELNFDHVDTVLKLKAAHVRKTDGLAKMIASETCLCGRVRHYQ
jgi:hypothetical protein